MDDKLLKKILVVSGVNKFGWHDNRHTFSSHMNDRQNADFVAIEACLNHVVEAKKGIAGVYNHATYAEDLVWLCNSGLTSLGSCCTRMIGQASSSI